MSERTPDPRDMDRVMGVGAKVILAWLDGDEEQVARLVNADVHDAVLGLVATAWAMGQLAYGDPEAARQAFAGAAIEGDLSTEDE